MQDVPADCMSTGRSGPRSTRWISFWKTPRQIQIQIKMQKQIQMKMQKQLPIQIQMQIQGGQVVRKHPNKYK